MCEQATKTNRACPNASRFLVSQRVYPQPLGPDGKCGTEGPNAGRSLNVCSVHVGAAVAELAALPIAVAGILPTVSHYRRD